MLSVLKWGNINKIYSLIKSIKEDIIRYKILIKKPQLSKDTFTFYSETTSLEIADLKHKLVATDYIAAKIAEGVATREEYAEKLAERAAWRARINELEDT